MLSSSACRAAACAEGAESSCGDAAVAAAAGVAALAAAAAFVGGAAARGSEVLLGGDAVDVAVLDGSEFCGWQELSQVYGARIIALDDTRALKHRRSREFLQASGCYTALADKLHDRNGWAIFERAPGSVCAPFPL
jgi:hypothetical protein